jgi:PEP-CTERM motif
LQRLLGLEVPLVRFRSGLLLLLLLVLVFGVASRSHASAILFNDRAEFDSFLEGDYQLFTEFPITDASFLPLTLVGIGDYGGLRFAGDVFNQISFLSTLSSFPRPDSGLFASLSRQVTAVGFDVVASNVFLPGSFSTFDFSAPIPADALFTFGTTNGLVAQTTLTPLSFFGVVLIDDFFNGLAWGTAPHPSCGFCARSVSIDNLAVQSVPEPSSALLLLTGASALIAARRRR